MKIAIIRNPWKNSDFGGAEELALNLTHTLNNSNVTDAVLISGARSINARASELGVAHSKGPYCHRQILNKHRSIFLPYYLLSLYLSYRKYLKIFDHLSPDIVHAMGQQEMISATAAASKRNIPVIWSDHGELKNSLFPKTSIQHAIIRHLLSAQIHKVSSILMVNPMDISLVKSKLDDPSIVTTVPNGVVDKYKQANQAPNYDFVFASRVIREKGVFEFIEAIRKLSDDNPKFRFLIAGSGPSLKQVERLIDKNNTVIEDYSDEAIETSSVFVLPTYTEAQSLAILKAMMYKKPIVTTLIDGNTHFLKHLHNAYLCKPRDSRSLYEALKMINLDSDLRAKLSSNARKYYEANNKLELIVSNYYLPIYKGLIKS